MKKKLKPAVWLLLLAVFAACSTDRDARFMRKWEQIQAEFEPLPAGGNRSEREAQAARYKEKLTSLLESVEAAQLNDSTRLVYARALLELNREDAAEALLLPLASHTEAAVRRDSHKNLMRIAAVRKDADSMRRHYAQLVEVLEGNLESEAQLLLESGIRMRDVDLELALELIDRGLSVPVPQSADAALNMAIHIRFVDGGLGHRERGIFLDRMAQQYADRPQIMNQIQRKRGFLEFLGRPAPELDQPGTWLNSEMAVQLQELKGRWVLLDFFAPWCPDCRNSLPQFRQLAEKLKQRMTTIMVTRFYGFYADEETPVRRNLSREEELKLLQNYLKARAIDLPFLVAENEETHNRFNASAIPHYVLIAPDGTVAELCMERAHGFFARVEARVMGE